MIYNSSGILFPGIYVMSWNELIKEFGFSTHRIHLFEGMKRALLQFQYAGCQQVYIDGSFVTKKFEPGDYDACWDTIGVDVKKLDPVFTDFTFGTKPQKFKYYGEFYPAGQVSRAGMTFLDFFQTDKSTGDRKGIIKIELGRLQ